MGFLSGLVNSVTGNGLLSAGASLLGGIMGKEGQDDANSANAAMAKSQMDFQERMSSTSYQRAVKDMEAAGLNPMLAYSQGGASSPGGSTAVMGNSKLAGLQAAQASLSSANMAAQNDLLDAQTEKTRAEKALVEAQTGASTSSAGHLDAQKDQIRQNMQKFVHEYDLVASDAKLRANQAGRESVGYNVDLATQDARIARLRSEASAAAHKATLLGLDVPQSEVFADFYRSAAGKASPYVDMGSRALGTLTSSAYRLNAMDRR